MTRLIFGIALSLTALFALTQVAARVQPINTAAAAALNTCAVPCWRGIEPNVTSKIDAVAQLNAAFNSEPERPLCFTTLSGVCDLYQWALPGDPQITTGIQIVDEKVEQVAAKAPGFTLGDLVLTVSAHQQRLSATEVGYGFNTLYVWLSFAHSSIGVSAQVECPSAYVDLLQAPVDSIVVQPPADDALRLPTTFGDFRQTFYRLCEQ
ncbi:MAG TPA: hypothetical protein VHD90_00390 [Phototrophicaceae bacterium]|nr:hypothetical protein [Phototrophicaceae bacterium]